MSVLDIVLARFLLASAGCLGAGLCGTGTELAVVPAGRGACYRPSDTRVM